MLKVREDKTGEIPGEKASSLFHMLFSLRAPLLTRFTAKSHIESKTFPNWWKWQCGSHNNPSRQLSSYRSHAYGCCLERSDQRHQFFLRLLGPPIPCAVAFQRKDSSVYSAVFVKSKHFVFVPHKMLLSFFLNLALIDQVLPFLLGRQVEAGMFI